MILLDSSYLVSLFNSDDQQHQRAKSIQAQLGTEDLLLSEYVVLEVSTVLGMKTKMANAKLAVQSLLACKEIVLYPCDQIFSSTLQRFFSQNQYSLSFVDCSLLVMLDNNLAQKLVTFDEDLIQATADKHHFNS